MYYILKRYGSVLCKDGQWHRTQFKRNTNAWPKPFRTKKSAETAQKRFGRGTELGIMGGAGN